MDNGGIAYSMSCAMRVVVAGLVEVLSGQNVEVGAQSVGREVLLFQLQVALQDPGVLLPEGGEGLSVDLPGAGDVGGAGQVVASRVEEQHGGVVDVLLLLLFAVVVDDGRVGA